MCPHKIKLKKKKKKLLINYLALISVHAGTAAGGKNSHVSLMLC